MRYEFLVDTYSTERVKVLSVWSMFQDGDLAPAPRPGNPPPLHPSLAEDSAKRLDVLRARPDDWWEAEVAFFDVGRSRAWVMLRRIAHTAHHRGQQTTLLRMLNCELYSTYGPTADTGGLFQHRAPTVYAYPDEAALLSGEAAGGVKAALPSPGGAPITERP